MMRRHARSLILAALGVGLLAAPSVIGPGARANSTTTKVAVLDLERAIYETTMGKEAEAKFEKLRAKKQAELTKETKSLNKYAAELDKQATVLKADVLAQKKKELDEKLVALEQLYRDLERNLAGERAKLVKEILKQATPFIEELAATEGVDVIVDQGAVVWSSQTVDLTDELTAKMK